jgi:hypothetical protein
MATAWAPQRQTPAPAPPAGIETEAADWFHGRNARPTARMSVPPARKENV